MNQPISTSLAFAASGEASRAANEADEARRESEEQLRSAIEAAELGTWDFYPQTGELRWSNQCKRLFGLSPTDNISYEAFLARLHPEDRERTDAAVTQAMKPHGSGQYTVEYRAMLGDGATRWLRATGRAYFRDGQVARFIGTVEDIDGRKQAEIDRDRFFSLGADFMVVADFDGNFLRVSPNWQDVFGWTLRDMTEKPWLDFVHPDDVTMTMKSFEQQRREGGDYNAIENRYRTKEGEYRWLHWRAKVFPNEKLIYAGATDITERKQAEKELIENEARLSIVAKATSDAIWDWDMATDRVWWNEGVTTMLGYERSAVGAHADWWVDQIHPDDRARVNESIHHAIDHGVRWNDQYRFRKADGSYADIHDNGYPILGENGKTTRMVGSMQDVTAQTVIEGEMREARAESDRMRLIYESALSNTPDFSYIFALDGRFIYANEALLTTWGRTREDAIGKNCFELGYPEWHAEMHQREIEMVAATRRPMKGVVPFTGTHGRRMYEYIFAPVIDGRGEVIAVAGTTRDVTEHSETERRFRELADSMPHMIWVTQPDGFHEYYNKRWYEFTGVTEGTTDGEGWNDMFHPDDQARAWARWRHSLETGEPYEIEYRLRRHDGVYRWVLGRALPARDKEGKITTWYGTCTDIGEQLEREQFIRSILDSSPDCVKVLDLEGRLLSMNENGMKQMEIDDFSFCLNEPWVDFWEGKNHDKADRAFREARTGNTARFEGLCKTAKGVPKWWEVVVTPIRSNDGEPTRLLSISRDITERHRLNEQLERALNESETARDQAQQANLAKSEFLANMSHEIRTPMNAVIGLSNIMALTSPLSDKQKELIRTLQMSADSLLALINDLLDISKIEARTIELEKIPFSLERLVQEVISMMAVRTREKGLIFKTDTECANGRTFIGDPTRLRQIVLNLCSNAVKFTDQGTIHIRVTCEETDIQGIELIKIAVEDTGIGIAADKLETIFHKFVQADTSINRKYGGTGLGLAITKTLTGIMGGDISVESTPDKGSCFTVSLPLEAVDALPETLKRGKTQTAHEHSEATSKHVLLVEDHAPNVLVATIFLQQFGYSYDVADNGAEAVRRAKAQRYDAVLMDVQMHGMNGFEATQQIREHEKAKALPPVYIIGMTAHALAGDRERCLAAGMSDYISKPFNPEDLREKLAIGSRNIGD